MMINLLSTLLIFLGGALIIAGVALTPVKSIITVTVGNTPDSYITIRDDAGILRRIGNRPDGKGGFQLTNEPIQ